MKVTLHIGQSKTGTSAIQSYMTLNREALTKQGIAYPAPTVWGMPIDLGSHNAVADAIAGRVVYPFRTAEQYKAEFFRQAEKIGASRMVLSAEHFFGGEPRVWDVDGEEAYFSLYGKKVQKTADWLSGHEVDLLVYLRPHHAWFASAIAQTIRTAGLTKGLNADLSDDGFLDLFRPLLNYTRIMEAWRDVLRPASMQIVPYTRSTLKDGSSIADFLHRAGISPEQLTHASLDLDVNSSLTSENLEVKRLLNRHPRPRTFERLAIRRLEKLSKQFPGPTSYLVDPAVNAKITQLAEGDVARLEQGFGVNLPVIEPAPKTRQFDDHTIQSALARFEKSLKGPRANLDWLNLVSRSAMREHALPLHALVHQAKRKMMDLRYRRRT